MNGVKAMEERQLITSVVRHECSHLVVGNMLGFRTGKIQLLERHAGAEIVLQPEFAELDGVRDYCERRVKILYAGVCGESLDKGKVRQESALQLIKNTATDDHSKARELIRIIVGIGITQLINAAAYQKLLDDVDAALWRSAVELVEKHAGVIVDLTVHFMSKRDDAQKAGSPTHEFTLAASDIAAFLSRS